MAKTRLNLTLDNKSIALLRKLQAEVQAFTPNRRVSASELVDKAIQQAYRSLRAIYTQEMEYHQAMLLAYADLIKKQDTAKHPKTALQEVRHHREVQDD